MTDPAEAILERPMSALPDSPAPRVTIADADRPLRCSPRSRFPGSDLQDGPADGSAQLLSASIRGVFPSPPGGGSGRITQRVGRIRSKLRVAMSVRRRVTSP